MSYARFGPDSDVYVFQTCGLLLACCDCRLREIEATIPWASFSTAREALDHLKRHIDAGHKVPDYTIEEIKEDFPDLDLQIANE